MNPYVRYAAIATFGLFLFTSGVIVGRTTGGNSTKLVTESKPEHEHSEQESPEVLALVVLTKRPAARRMFDEMAATKRGELTIVTGPNFQSFTVDGKRLFGSASGGEEYATALDDLGLLEQFGLVRRIRKARVGTNEHTVLALTSLGHDMKQIVAKIDAGK